MSNRREFFAAASSSLALAGLSAPSLALAKPTVARRVGGSPTLSAFEGLQGQDFKVATGGSAGTTLRLVAVKAHDSAQPIEQFTLVLSGSTKRPLDSDVYQLEHVQAGRFQLRLEPSGTSAQGSLYRADLSLLV